MTRCAIYTRVSTGDQTVENQLLQLRQFAATQGMADRCRILRRNLGKHIGSTRPLMPCSKLRQKRQFDVLVFLEPGQTE